MSVALLVCGGAFLLWTPISYAATYYVDATTGSDSNDGLAWGSAFKSIAKATDRYGSLTAGDTILVKPGTYSGFEITKAGTPTSRITISRFGSGDVIVSSSIPVSGGWTLSSGQIYSASLAAGPAAVVVDRVPLLPEFSLGAMTEGKFYYGSGRIYVWAPGGGSPATHVVGIVGTDIYSPGVILREAHNVTVQGLTFQYASGHGVEVYANNVVFDDCTFEFNGKAGFDVYAYGNATADNVTIQNSRVYHNVLTNWPRGQGGFKWCCWAMGIVSNGTPNFKAIGNIVHKNGGEGIGAYSGSGGTIIRDNISYDNWSVNIYVDNQPNAIIEKNISYCTTPNTGDLYNNQDPDPSDNRNARRLRAEGIMLGNEDYGSGFNLRNVQVTNNLVSNCRRGITYYGEGGGLQDVTIANNSVVVAAENEVGGGWLTGIAIPAYGTNSNTIVKNNIIYSTNPTNTLIETSSNHNTTFNNNLYYATTNSTPFRYNDTAVNFTTWKSSIGNQDVASINQNPQFVSIDPTSTNFLKINSNSPAINMGATLTQVTTDFSGVTRPIGSAYDIGAYEYGTSTPDTTPPTLPSNFNLAASATSQSSITVSWNPATDDIGVTGYQVERCTGLSCTTFTQVGTPTTSPFVDSGLTPSTGYSYHVRALDAAGNMSSWSNVVGATTQAPDTTPPTAPTSLTATASSSSQINLTWTASTDNVGVTGYKVERCQGSSCTNFSEITNQPTTNYQDTSLSPSTTYRYQVRAVDGAGNNSAYSSIAQATTQVAPPVSVNMMAAYNFNENTGTTINDLSGHTNTGTASNATWTTSGKNGSALSFNGSSSSVSVSDNNTLDITGSFTLSAWIYSSNLSGYRDVVLKGNNANNYYLETNGTNISFGFYQSGVWHEHNSTSANLQTNTWTHIAGVFDTDANTVTLYKNGVQIYQASETGTPPANTLPLTIGSGFSGENYGGSIDDVRIYNKALTQTEIQTDMNTPLTQPTSTVSCNTVTTTNFSQAAYNSYGAPFDAFQTGTNLLDAKCNSADAHTINLTTGVTGDTTRIVYTKGYYYDPVTAGWTQYSGTCNGALNGEWCQGSVSATITSPNLSTASASNPAYLVGMTCSVQGGGWKCGCRDTSCANFYWQVQGAGM